MNKNLQQVISSPSNFTTEVTLFNQGTNTVKFFRADDPFGGASFISPAFGGCVSDKEILNQCGFYEEIEEGDGCLFDRYVLELVCGMTVGSVQSFHALLTFVRSEFNN